MRTPALFISHGTPMAGLFAKNPEEDRYANALRKFALNIPKPKAIVILSAHGTSSDKIVEVSTAHRNKIIHDFRGFPSDLYLLEYDSPGLPDLSVRIASTLAAKGFESALSANMFLDHGAWIPLSIMYPDADVPIIQITMPYPDKPESILKLGQSLASYREEGILIVGSGGAVHNLEEMVWHGKTGPSATWAIEFENWMVECLKSKDVESLLNYEDRAPHALKAQPSAEHFYPLLFTVGAALVGDEMKPIYEGTEYHSLSMFSFALTKNDAKV